jgi:hypothetical protein
MLYSKMKQLKAVSSDCYFICVYIHIRIYTYKININGGNADIYLFI